MIFIILAALLVPASVGYVGWKKKYGWGEPTLGGVVLNAVSNLLIAAAAWGLACLITSMAWSGVTNPASVDTQTYKLAALSNVQSTEGRFFFLGTGYINGEQEFAFVENHGSYSTLETADGGQYNRVFQDEQKHPHVDVHTYHQSAWFLFPAWDWYMWNTTYDFHVPSGSVASNYDVDVTK